MISIWALLYKKLVFIPMGVRDAGPNLDTIGTVVRVLPGFHTRCPPPPLPSRIPSVRKLFSSIRVATLPEAVASSVSLRPLSHMLQSTIYINTLKICRQHKYTSHRTRDHQGSVSPCYCLSILPPGPDNHGAICKSLTQPPHANFANAYVCRCSVLSRLPAQKFVQSDRRLLVSSSGMY